MIERPLYSRAISLLLAASLMIGSPVAAMEVAGIAPAPFANTEEESPSKSDTNESADEASLCQSSRRSTLRRAPCSRPKRHRSAAIIRLIAAQRSDHVRAIQRSNTPLAAKPPPAV